MAPVHRADRLVVEDLGVDPGVVILSVRLLVEGGSREILEAAGGVPFGIAPLGAFLSFRFPKKSVNLLP